MSTEPNHGRPAPPADSVLRQLYESVRRLERPRVMREHATETAELLEVAEPLPKSRLDKYPPRVLVSVWRDTRWRPIREGVRPESLTP
jgi:hypothetical protein